MQIYYLNKKVRILADTYNFIPEVFCKGKTRTKNAEGKLEIVESDEEKWRRLGYYPTMEGAIKGLMRVIPVVIGDSENKAVDSLKGFLKVLADLKKSIKVEIEKGVSEKDLNDADLEEDNSNGSSNKRKSARATKKS